MNKKQLESGEKYGTRIGGYNGFVRRLFWPGMPPTECVDGYLMFPWGTGPFWPIYCDFDTPFITTPLSFGSEFHSREASHFVDVVSELADESTEKVMATIENVASIDKEELLKLSVIELAKIIFDATSKDIKHPRIDSTMVFGEYIDSINKAGGKFDSALALRSLAKQMGISRDTLRKMPLSDIPTYIDVIGNQDSDTGVSYRTGTTVCAVNSAGQMTCGVVNGVLEGLMWGGVIGGVIGGAVGAAIGAVIGGLLSWLWGD
ncbi:MULTISPECIES: hypothetical protein [Vibrio]|uniref:hypothetical protein n=1 Tax=Vibrio TaxID=662 RepID=UPI000E6794E1|nr:hypothetical protein [Vibrio sp. PID23_8]RIZ53272.1 hypothetical protein AK966_13650 [Vibrio sp. PID23_8]